MSVEIKGASYEPQTPDEHIRGISLLLPIQERGGFIFLTAYTKKENADSEFLLQVLMDQTRRLADTFGKEANPQHRFEQFLGALNETLAEHVREGHWNLPIDQFHALIGIASTTQMYLSGTGELVALFLHKKPSQRYQVFNLFRGLQTEQSLLTWEKAFAIVLDGDLHPGDVFCVTDKDIQQMIPTDELNHILSSLPPIGAVEKVRQYFSHKEGLLLTILKTTDDAIPSSSHQSRSAVLQSNLSVEELNSTETTTDRLLDDQRPSISIIIKKITAFIQSKTDQRSRLLKDLQTQGSLQHSIKKIGRIVWKGGVFFGKYSLKKATNTAHLLNNKEERTKIKEHLQIKQRDAHGSVLSLVSRVRGVQTSTKYLIGGIAVALLVLTIGISVISKSQSQATDERVYQEHLTEIEDIMERAAGAVIYKDENQARSLYVNAQTLIEELSVSTPEREEISQGLNNDLQAALNEIRHLVTIPNPPLLADLALLTDGVFGNTLLFNGNSVYVAGSDGRVYLYNNTEKRFESVTATPEEAISSIASTEEDGRMYLLNSSGSVSSISLENTSVSALGIADAYWIDFEAYANRLYFLRPSGNGVEGQIIRFNRSGSSFTDESEWITSRTVSFDHAVSIAVDGNAYVLMQDGSISRFASGAEEGWDTGIVDPRITQATKLWTDTESEYLYILEPTTQRLIVFKKDTGEFVVQYRSDAFSGITDFIIDEAGYTIYLLAGSKLYSIAPSHLE
ncbi:hypothetical protein HQ487_00180 [Candidatus Uhrbacteria bacterium]|nr:hypothetical protein [Candidatus Uhrbacteria bacterium]